MSSALHVESVGSGPDLMLLHGWAMHSGIWGPVLERLGRRFRVHAVDLPGHGHSPLNEPFTLDNVSASVGAAIPADSGAVTVLGWSIGGLVAMCLARQQPASIARLVLVATTPRFASGTDWPHGMSPQTLAQFGDELDVAWKLTIQRFLALQLQGSDRGRAALATLRHQIFARGEPSAQALFGALEVIATTDLRALVPEIPQPSLVISGSRDTLAPPEAGRWLAERLPHARFALIDGAAHVPFLSHPDAFMATLDAFLDDRSSARR
jgi:pimeloyl-[acyl-carrier protein] methyl ester esterase